MKLLNKLSSFSVPALLLVSSVASASSPLIPPVDDADFYDNGAPADNKVELGRVLFFDKVLSGNLNISCATCHHSMAWTGDGLSLPSGEGGNGLGITRDTGYGDDAIHERVPRNAQPIFNLGAREFRHLFHDGRVAGMGGGFLSPAGDDLPDGLDNVLAAQAMFPVTSTTEMAGQAGENAQADAATADQLAGPGGVWDIIAKKLQAIPEYVEMFKAVYPGEVNSADDISFVHAANAIAAFEAKAWRFDNSPFDQHLRGKNSAMTAKARRGMRLFYGKAGCGDCHSGPFQTDQMFHAIAMPQIGPGKGNNQAGYNDGHDDFGREMVTGQSSHRYMFRTPTLRNVALTAPYGHAGAYDSLDAVIRHHLNAPKALREYDQSQAVLSIAREEIKAVDFAVMNDQARLDEIIAANQLPVIKLRNGEISAVIEFLNSLTDLRAVDLRRDVPAKVPSGLPIWD